MSKNIFEILHFIHTAFPYIIMSEYSDKLYHLLVKIARIDEIPIF